MAEKILNKNNFDSEVTNSDIPVVVDFWAPWCGPCMMMGPIIEKLAQEADGKYIVGKVNVDEEEELSERFGVMSIPTIKVFKNGEISATSIGLTTGDKIKQMVEAV